MTNETQLTGFPAIAAQGIWQESSTALHTIGCYVETADGRGFRYSKIGATATVAGKVYQGVALDATNLQPSGGLTPSANVAIGDTSITVADTITLTADQLAGGYLSVVVTPGQGYNYKIRGNTAVTAAASAVITLEDPLQIAITTASNFIMAQHPYNGLVVEPGTPTAAIAGVAHRVTTATYYGWIQTRGAASVLFTGTGLAGKAVGSLSGGTAGSCAPAIAATNILGYHMATGITGEYSLIYLTIG
jgi:hypothetical protein